MCPPAPKWARWGSKLCPRHRKSSGRVQKPIEMCPPAPKWARWGSKLCPRHRKSRGREQKPTEMCPPRTFCPHQAPSVWTYKNNFLSASTKDTLFVDKSRLPATENLPATDRPTAVAAPTTGINYFFRVKTNLNPPPALLVTEILPPWNCTACFTMERPSPVPPIRRDRPLSIL